MMPPPLLLFPGDWPVYERQLYAIFIGDIAQGGIEFRGQPVNCRRHPEANGRWAAFWHLIQEGKVEEDRQPDLRRCERLKWVRWVLEQYDSHAAISVWENVRESERNVLFWYNEEYLVVLSQRSTYWLLKTAYCTTQSRRIAQLRRERDAFIRSSSPSPR